MRHVHRLSIHFDCERAGPHFFGDRYGENARCSRHGNRQNQGETQQSEHAEQEAELPRIKWGLFTVAPMRWGAAVGTMHDRETLVRFSDSVLKVEAIVF